VIIGMGSWSKKSLFLLVCFALSVGLACSIGSYLGLNELVNLKLLKIESNSMHPSLVPEMIVVVDTNTYQYHQPERGDIIACYYPPDPNAIPYIKRVIGLPGDTIAVKGGKVSINGKVIDEPYLKGLSTHGTGIWTLQDDQYFVMGDNRNNSSDSRSWGPVLPRHIIGKAVWIYAPRSKFGPIKDVSYPEVEP
jgi:signal peptidase I